MDGFIQRLGGPGGQFPQDGLDLAPHFLDGIEVRGIRRKVFQTATGRPDGVRHALLFVAAEVVQDHDVARAQRRDENVENILVEDFAVGGGVDAHAGRPSIAEEGTDEGSHSPVAVGGGVTGALAAQGPPVQADHLGRHGGFIDEHEVFGDPFRAFCEPVLPLDLNFRTVLFGGPKRFFYRSASCAATC